jgi:ribonuclease P protein component
VSRKVGGAVERNRVKRLLREAFSAEGQRLPEGMDAVVVARRDAHALAQGEGLTGVRRVLSELLDRAVGAREDGAPSAGGAGSQGMPAAPTGASASPDGSPGSSS